MSSRKKVRLQHQSHFGPSKKDKSQAGPHPVKPNRKTRTTIARPVSRRPNVQKTNEKAKSDQKVPASDEIFWKKINSCKNIDEFWNETVKANLEDLRKEKLELLDRVQKNYISDDSEESENSS